MNPVSVPQFIATQNPCSIENLNYTALVAFSILILPLYFQGLGHFSISIELLSIELTAIPYCKIPILPMN